MRPDDTLCCLINKERPDQRPTRQARRDDLRKHTAGELRPLSRPIGIVNCDSEFPHKFEPEAERIWAALRVRLVHRTRWILSSGAAGEAAYRHRSRVG